MTGRDRSIRLILRPDDVRLCLVCGIFTDITTGLSRPVVSWVITGSGRLHSTSPRGFLVIQRQHAGEQKDLAVFAPNAWLHAEVVQEPQSPAR
jgi:hypothetical protein